MIRFRRADLSSFVRACRAGLLVAGAAIGTPPSFCLAAWEVADETIMGTHIHMEVWHDAQPVAAAAVASALTELRRIDRLMTPYSTTSDVGQVNARAASQAVEISAETFNLIRTAQAYSELSGGAFDITFAAVGHLYDLRNRVKPSAQQVAMALPAIGYRQLQLDTDHRTLRFTHPRMRIDLGGIAKGYAVDNAVAALRRHGIESALIMAGGDTAVLGNKNGKPWRIGIRDPRNAEAMVGALPIADAAVSTSGDYERFFVEDGVRHHHILDPKTGHPAKACRSVTVVGPNATTTDALSTTVFVLGPEKGMALVEQLPRIEAVIIDAQGQQHISSGLAGTPAP